MNNVHRDVLPLGWYMVAQIIPLLHDPINNNSVRWRVAGRRWRVAFSCCIITPLHPLPIFLDRGDPRPGGLLYLPRLYPSNAADLPLRSTWSSGRVIGGYPGSARDIGIRRLLCWRVSMCPPISTRFYVLLPPWAWVSPEGGPLIACHILAEW